VDPHQVSVWPIAELAVHAVGEPEQDLVEARPSKFQTSPAHRIAPRSHEASRSATERVVSSTG